MGLACPVCRPGAAGSVACRDTGREGGSVRWWRSWGSVGPFLEALEAQQGRSGGKSLGGGMALCPNTWVQTEF